MRLRATTALFALGVGLAGAVAAQPAPLGAPFQVNTATTASQSFPDVAAVDDQFLVVWQDAALGGFRTSGQRFRPDGQRMGTPFTIPVSDPYAQRDPRVALEDDGSFVIQWRSSFQSTYYVVDAVRARAFDTDSTPAEDAFVVSVATNQYASFPDHEIAPGPAGTFVVVLADYYQSYIGSPNGGVQSRRFTADGMQVDFSSIGGAFGSTRARLQRGPNHDFVVAWSTFDYFTQYNTFHVRRLDTDGIPMGGTIDVTTGDLTGGDAPDAALAPGGDFTVVWTATDALYGQSVDVYARSFAADDQPKGDALVVSTHTGGSRSRPRVARGGDGNFLVVWQTSEAPASASDTDGWSIRGRRLDGMGVPIGDTFQVNEVTTGDQLRPVVTATPDGTAFIVAWQSEASDGGDTDSWSIRARRYATDLVRFVDGFESGDTSAWDVTTP